MCNFWSISFLHMAGMISLSSLSKIASVLWILFRTSQKDLREGGISRLCSGQPSLTYVCNIFIAGSLQLSSRNSVRKFGNNAMNEMLHIRMHIIVSGNTGPNECSSKEVSNIKKLTWNNSDLEILLLQTKSHSLLASRYFVKRLFEKTF